MQLPHRIGDQRVLTRRLPAANRPTDAGRGRSPEHYRCSTSTSELSRRWVARHKDYSGDRINDGARDALVDDFRNGFYGGKQGRACRTPLPTRSGRRNEPSPGDRSLAAFAAIEADALGAKDFRRYCVSIRFRFAQFLQHAKELRPAWPARPASSPGSWVSPVP
jgi:hypothetical protein